MTVVNSPAILVGAASCGSHCRPGEYAVRVTADYDHSQGYRRQMVPPLGFSYNYDHVVKSSADAACANTPPVLWLVVPLSWYMYDLCIQSHRRGGSGGAELCACKHTAGVLVSRTTIVVYMYSLCISSHRWSGFSAVQLSSAIKWYELPLNNVYC